MPPLKPSQSKGLTITNPLVLYRALLATKKISPDPAQHRLALHLQKLYLRLKDYNPANEYGARLQAINRTLGKTPKSDRGREVAVEGHPLRNNPLFRHLFKPKTRSEDLALTQVLTSHEAAMKLDSPRGMLVHGEVGTGKSMLVDLLCDCLPNKKKRRWHFNTFMLETISHLESLRLSQSASFGKGDSAAGEPEYSLLWLAKKLVEESPILFLDEFQLPDRAASKILSNLLTAFFQLGGVLIATSNRIPDELSKAAGIEFAPPPRTTLGNWFGLGSKRIKGDMFGGQNEFAAFLEVLKARCEIWNIEGEKDWRRRGNLVGKTKPGLKKREASVLEEVESDEDDTMQYENAGEESAGHEMEQAMEDSSALPEFFLVSEDQDLTKDEAWNQVLSKALSLDPSQPISWKPAEIQVYGRTISVPKTYSGTTYWTFPTLCGGNFGPADFLSLASTFHTIILDEVPVMSLLQKNEARRMITLLDAIYEARGKLIIRASAGPDELFFPERPAPQTSKSSTSASSESPSSTAQESIKDDATYAEVFSDIYQDLRAPFRPNISSYDPSNGHDPDESTILDPVSGIPTTPEQVELRNQLKQQRGPDFANTSSFTGEDERFAFKRARSRLWELCSSHWHARNEPDWWRPLPLEVRRWERGPRDQRQVGDNGIVRRGKGGDVRIGDFVELDRPAGLQGKELENWEKEREVDEGRGVEVVGERQREAPRFGEAHAWGTVRWGKKAGEWGKGTDAFAEKWEGGKGGKDT